MSRGVWWLPVAAVIALIVGCFGFQGALKRAEDVDRLLLSGELDEAITKMESLGEDAFPKVWDPPPKSKKNEYFEPDLSELMATIQRNEAPPWVADRLLLWAPELIAKQAEWRMATDEDYYMALNLRSHDPKWLEELRDNYKLLASMPTTSSEHQAERDRWLGIVEQGIVHATEYRKPVEPNESEEPDELGK